MEYIKEMFSKRRVKIALLSLIFGLPVLFLFSGKTSARLESIAVSPDEQYIACFEAGYGLMIRCFHADGSLAFEYEAPLDIGNGGYCAIWFEEDELCALFYKTHNVVHFAMDGTILNITDGTDMEYPPNFPSFKKQRRKYIFDGNKIEVVYNKQTFAGYWFFGAERYLEIIPKSGEPIIVYSWTAKEGVTEKAD